MRDSYPVRVEKLKQNQRSTVDDWVAIEEPLEIRLGFVRKNHERVQPVAITMRTPGDEFELAVGFLMTEAIVKNVSEVSGVKFCGEGPDGAGKKNENVVRVDVHPDVDVDLEKLKRNFYVTSSCGVCGKSSLDALDLAGYEPVRSEDLAISFEQIRTLPSKLRSQQETFQKTGGLHAAALFDSNGELLCVREDVGRHNAVDKVIGAHALSDGSFHDCGLLLSGRISFELVQKAISQGISIVCAVGAPSSLAVQSADQFGVTLIGFLGEERANIYTHSSRVVSD